MFHHQATKYGVLALKMIYKPATTLDPDVSANGDIQISSTDKPSEYQCVNGVYTLKPLVFTRIQTLSPSTMKTHTKLIPQASE